MLDLSSDAEYHLIMIKLNDVCTISVIGVIGGAPFNVDCCIGSVRGPVPAELYA